MNPAPIATTVVVGITIPLAVVVGRGAEVGLGLGLEEKDDIVYRKYRIADVGLSVFDHLPSTRGLSDPFALSLEYRYLYQTLRQDRWAVYIRYSTYHTQSPEIELEEYRIVVIVEKGQYK